MRYLPCVDCQVDVPQAKTGWRRLCDECCSRRHREREAERRVRKGEEIRSRDRERYATNERVRERKLTAAHRQYEAIRTDSRAYIKRRVQAREAEARYRAKWTYGGARPYVLQRDDHRCQRCSRSVAGIEAHIHHLDGRGSLLPVEEQNNDPDNLITLCWSCHAAVHRENEKINGGGRWGS